ncbi:MAG: hypothetical protein K2G69_02315, partial [Muribaculaceae bacterium]|nr:hypothetical protein [Muribaculaceae bacterium]
MERQPHSAAIQRMKYVVSDFLTSSVAFFLFNVARFHILFSGSSLFFPQQSPEAFLLTPKLITEQLLVPLFMLGIYW